MEITFLVVVKHIKYYLIIFFLLFIGFVVFFQPFNLYGSSKNLSSESSINPSGESYQSSIIPTCVSRYLDSVNNYANELCFPVARPYDLQGESYYINSSLTNSTLIPSIKFENSKEPVFKSLVNSSTIPRDTYDNVAEPSFASNGSFVLYAGNHFAATLNLGGEWRYLNPNFDLKIQKISDNTNSTILNNTELVPNFRADQHIEYDPIHEMFIWIRLSEFITPETDTPTNILRLSLSKNGVDWLGYDFYASEVLERANVLYAFFDYPDTILTPSYFYMTTSVFDQRQQANHGLIFRISLEDLSDSLDTFSYPAGTEDSINYNVYLDKNVSSIAPVDHSKNPVYFGTHMPINNSLFKVYDWPENLSAPTESIFSIKPWNYINNLKVCSENSTSYWWCLANTGSRIRSAWADNDTITFMWNAIHSPNNGTTWIPYIESATFTMNSTGAYERKYYIADKDSAWLFGAGSQKGDDIRVATLFVDMNKPDQHIRPYVNFALGKFNDTSNKWSMNQLLNSSSAMPVINESGSDDYNVGDFLTLKPHIGDSEYNWDMGGYIISGDNYYNADPYLIFSK